MTDCPETVTVTLTVTYKLKVSIAGVSGVQEWGPFFSREAAEQTVSALATRPNVDKVEIERIES